MGAIILVNGVEIDLYSDVPYPLNYTIQDIRNPEKRTGDFSKTITLPATHKNNTLFSHIFQIDKIINSTDLSLNFVPDFNPNLKAECIFYIDNIKIFQGYLQLLNINLMSQSKFEYEVAMFGQLSNIYRTWGEKLINQLDWSASTHTYNKANQEATWGYDSDDADYCYPMINYGKSSVVSFNVNDFRPATFVKSIVDKAFTDAGFTYNSAFFNSALFKKLIIPNSGKNLTISGDYKNKLEFQIFQSGQGSFPSIDIAEHLATSTAYVLADMVNDVDNGAYNLGGDFVVASKLHYPQQDGNYNYSFDINFSTKIIFAFGNVDDTINPRVIPMYNHYRIRVLKNGSTILWDSGLLSKAVYQGTGDTWHDFETHQLYESDGVTESIINASGTINANVDNGDYVGIYITFHPDIANVEYLDSSVLTNGNANFILTSKGGFFSDNIVAATLSDGASCQIGSYMPSIKIKDVFTSLIKMFNLYVMPDKDTPTLLHIEPRDDYYTEDVIDWSAKVDTSKVWKITPMGELDVRKYNFTFAEDTDYYNKLHKENNKYNYGQWIIDVKNDFVQSEVKNETIFAPTVIVADSISDRVIPTIISKDANDVVSTFEAKPRILYFGGTQSTGSAWSYVGSSGTTSKTTYPYASHLDSTTAPTLDILFGAPYQLWYSATTYTSGGLVNVYWSKFLKEITDSNSKILTIPVYLKPIDILTLDFRKLYKIDGNYYRLNKIIDYDPYSHSTTQGELLKIRLNTPHVVHYTPMIPSVTNVDIVEGGQDEVRDLGATFFYNLIEAGEDDVRSIGATSVTNLINGGNNAV